jgi:hypothetical protein
MAEFFCRNCAQKQHKPGQKTSSKGYITNVNKIKSSLYHTPLAGHHTKARRQYVS